ncbi:competence protein CoiA family protein [Anaerocolumna sp. MB42-C2]|uniref:competence protein CoiA family protein n=1 Tax=Anaerocolumna sp. MB42-C2 TaxID=3070997 RepID=UPI0027E00390|nr:competence protein CoiA family protein [Anaerocolumna sp. MB42-C2]WMJ89078.1 competence protein CoiA family protein [Anaerocolumna sp. MB42-C2]
MENCFYNGKEICTYDLKDKYHYYISELVEEWKLAANNGKLICSECGSSVYLAAGPIVEPYFAHYDKQSCPYGNLTESEELKKGKRLLYSLLRKSFPENEIHARYKMKNGIYSTCYVTNSDGNDIAIDYHLQHSSIGKFQERDQYYKSSQITPIYVLGINKSSYDNQISWYENLIQKSIGLCVFLDSWNEKILLKKSFDYKLGGLRKIVFCHRIYSIDDIMIDNRGAFISDFSDECNKIELSIKKEKELYEQMMLDKNKNISKMNDIRPDILNTALECLKRGEGQLVSKRYMDYIIENKLL